MRVVASLLLLLAGAFGAEPEFEDSVAVLTPDNFDDFIKAQDYTIVEFYAPWCGHCQSLAPEWAAAAAKTKRLTPKVYLAKVDADAHKDLATRFDVSGYPTIKIFKKGKAEEYEGPRESKGIIKFVKEAIGAGPTATLARVKTAADVEAMTAKGPLLLGIFREPTSASAMFKTFAEVASELPSEGGAKAAYSASYAKDPVAEKFAVKSVPAILFVKGDDVQSMTIPRKRTDFTEELLFDWFDGVSK